MCRSMVDIQSPTAEIRQGKKEEERRKKGERNHRTKISWPALLHRAAIKIYYVPGAVLGGVLCNLRRVSLEGRECDHH